MNPGRKMTERDKIDSERQGSDVVWRGVRDNPDGIDAIRVLQLIGGGLAVIILIWYILHNFLRII